MRWPQDAAGWPMADQSRLVLHRPHRWHIQQAGTGPTVLLIHGAGGATHSFRGLFPLIAATHHAVAVDLPGQGFTQLGARQRCGLDHMSADLTSLCHHLEIRPKVIIGHSAGAAVALRMAEIAGDDGPRVIGINAALGTFKGLAGFMFPVMARVLALSPLAAGLFSRTATRATVERLIAGTGSKLDAPGIDLYLRLVRDAAHVDGTLAMMAQWRLEGLLSRLPKIMVPVTLIAGSGDLAVPPDTSTAAAAQMRDAEVLMMQGLGHLAHEEDPEAVMAIVAQRLPR